MKHGTKNISTVVHTCGYSSLTETWNSFRTHNIDTESLQCGLLCVISIAAIVRTYFHMFYIHTAFLLCGSSHVFLSHISKQKFCHNYHIHKFCLCNGDFRGAFFGQRRRTLCHNGNTAESLATCQESPGRPSLSDELRYDLDDIFLHYLLWWYHKLSHNVDKLSGCYPCVE